MHPMTVYCLLSTVYCLLPLPTYHTLRTTSHPPPIHARTHTHTHTHTHIGTVVAYIEWAELEAELGSLTELEQDSDTEQELKEMVRGEMKELILRQEVLEDSIKIMLLPKDPNDDRDIMLEIRSGTIIHTYL
jgi:protein subunit release factor A